MRPKLELLYNLIVTLLSHFAAQSHDTHLYVQMYGAYHLSARLLGCHDDVIYGLPAHDRQASILLAIYLVCILDFAARL